MLKNNNKDNLTVYEIKVNIIEGVNVYEWGYGVGGKGKFVKSPVWWNKICSHVIIIAIVCFNVFVISTFRCVIILFWFSFQPFGPSIHTIQIQCYQNEWMLQASNQPKQTSP